MPQMDSHGTYPIPLTNACCSPSVRTTAQRSQICAMCRGSSTRARDTSGGPSPAMSDAMGVVMSITPPLPAPMHAHTHTWQGHPLYPNCRPSHTHTSAAAAAAIAERTVVACVAPRWQVSPVVPAHRVPRQCLAVCKGVLRGAVAGKQAAVIGAALGLRGKRPPAARHRSLVERTVDAKHRVAVEPVGAHRLDNLCQHRHVIVHRPVRTRVPGVVRQQHAHVGGVELRNQVGEARETTTCSDHQTVLHRPRSLHTHSAQTTIRRRCAQIIIRAHRPPPPTGECDQHVELRAVIHPDIWVRMPQQHRVHAAVASPCIREPRAHSPPSGAAIEEKAIV
eukprot:m.1119433 g.1119433  ORF g.1119433 m.1119433 type:complete len:336 (+) comp24391_c0_seq4:1083-2090(+)